MILSTLPALFATASVLAICIICILAGRENQEGPAGGAVRMLATLILPSMALAFAHLYFWWLSLALSLGIAAAQFRAGARQLHGLDLRWNDLALIPAAVTVALISVKAALSIASTPYDIDSNVYHLPMAIAYLQTHAAVPAQVMFHPGNSEIFDALGLGALGAVGGQTLTEAVVALALFLAACAIAMRTGASRSIAVAAGCVALAIPIVGDQVVTGQNDVLVAALLLAFVALWTDFPMLSAIALGLVAGTKFTGALEAVVLLPILWTRRSPLLSWRHVAVAAAIASPWYVRNALETGNAFFLGSQTSGFSSTIAAHLAVSAPSIFSAMRNYGGLLALLGVPAVVLLSRQKTSARTLAPYLPYLAAANLVLWLFIPNSATTRPGELNQILSGWSIRYAIFGLALLSVAGIVWLSRLNEKFAVAVATVVVLATSIREFRFALHVDPGAIAFAVPCAAAIVAAGLAFAARSTARLVATGLTACVVFAVAGSIGAERIAASWNDRYQGTAVLGSRYALGPAIDLATVREARRVGAIETPPLPLVGPHFERYVVADENGLPVDAWWRTIQIARPQAVVASALRSGGLSPNELRLRSSGLYRIVYAGPSLRVYVPVSGHGSLVAALKIER